jgi:ASC-1-like (ASCH) protein
MTRLNSDRRRPEIRTPFVFKRFFGRLFDMPQLHQMKLTAENFDLMNSGKKLSELRLNDEKRRRIQIGDQIEFRKLPELQESLLVEVLSLTSYPDFASLFEGVKDQYADWSKEAFIQGMHKHYSPEEEKNYGALAIGIKLSK